MFGCDLVLTYHDLCRDLCQCHGQTIQQKFTKTGANYCNKIITAQPL